MYEEAAGDPERNAEVAATMETGGAGQRGSGVNDDGVIAEVVGRTEHLRGMHKGAEPSCGGSREHRCVPAVFAGAQRASAWGEPARPGFPRRGNGKGAINFLAAAGSKKA